MHVQRNQPNWLLYALFAFSLTLHVFIFFYLKDLYNQRTEARIEVSLQDRVDPTKRAIPKPPSQSKPPIQTENIERLALTQPLRQDPESLSIDQVDYSHVKKLESLEAPRFVTSSNPLKDDWNFEPSVESQIPLSSQEYLEMVRLKIERHKQYPITAERRQLEGKVSIYLVVKADGTVEDTKITKSSGHSILDDAALTAVRNAAPFPKPPPEFHGGKIPIEVPIVFELL